MPRIVWLKASILVAQNFDRKRKSPFMGYSLRSIGTWIGLISFFAAIIAVANTHIQSPLLWLCLGFWVAIVFFYCLVKIIRMAVGMRKHPTGTYLRKKQQFQQSKEKKPSLKNKIGPNYTPLQQQASKNKGAGLQLPLLAGFAPHRLQASDPRQDPSRSKGYAPRQQQKAKGQEMDFKLPPLAGFSPQDLRKPMSKNPPQGSSPSKGFAFWQQQKAKRPEIAFKLPPLAGFAPQNLQKPTSKNPRQDPSQ